jgi:hypothetical protein
MRRELCGDDFVKEVLLHVGRENVVGEIDLTDLFALQIEYV